METFLHHFSFYPSLYSTITTRSPYSLSLYLCNQTHILSRSCQESRPSSAESVIEALLKSWTGQSLAWVLYEMQTIHDNLCLLYVTGGKSPSMFEKLCAGSKGEVIDHTKVSSVSETLRSMFCNPNFVAWDFHISFFGEKSYLHPAVRSNCISLHLFIVH